MPGSCSMSSNTRSSCFSVRTSGWMCSIARASLYCAEAARPATRSASRRSRPRSDADERSSAACSHARCRWLWTTVDKTVRRCRSARPGLYQIARLSTIGSAVRMRTDTVDKCRDDSGRLAGRSTLARRHPVANMPARHCANTNVRTFTLSSFDCRKRMTGGTARARRFGDELQTLNSNKALRIRNLERFMILFSKEAVMGAE